MSLWIPDAEDRQEVVTESFETLPDGGVFDTEQQPTPMLYLPKKGVLREEQRKDIKGGEVFLGHYSTPRAVHPISVYRPDGFQPNGRTPVTVMTGPLGTGSRGHNEGPAKEMMRDGAAVIFKGAPRYRKDSKKALGLNEDANEMHGLVRGVEVHGVLGKIPEVLGYGESQAAMKQLFFIALGGAYGTRVRDSLVVAPCYFEALDLKRPVENVRNLVGMATSTVNYARRASLAELWQKRRTLDFKDFLHHVRVIPVLTSGETGTSLPYIPTDQSFGVELMGKDGNSNPYETQPKLKALFPVGRFNLYPQYGHVDGIMSEEVAIQRSVMIHAARLSLGLDSEAA